jgi:phage/plasmid primase-like uncharacterized protein
MSQERTRDEDDDESWRSFKERALAAPIREAAERAGARLKQVGPHEWAGTCLKCGGRDGFSIDTETGRFACAASGESGDVLRMLRHTRGWGSIDACEFINSPDAAPKA